MYPANHHQLLEAGKLLQLLQVLSSLGAVNGPDNANTDRYSTEDLEHLLCDVLFHELQQVSFTALFQNPMSWHDIGRHHCRSISLHTSLHICND